MRFLAHLRHAYKLKNLTYSHKNFLKYTCVTIGGDKSNQKRCFASKASGGELNGDEGFQEAFAVLSLIRDNSRQVELVTENLENIKTKSRKDEEKENSNEGLEKNISNEIRSGIAVQSPAKSLPVNPAREFNEFPLPSMDTELTNLKKALLNPSNLLKSGNLKDSNLSLSTNTRLDPYDTTTIPLHLNTLISGNVDTDPMKIPQYQLKSLKVPEFNEYLTSLAANLCSAALQSGFPSESCRKSYCTLDLNSIQKLGDKKSENKVKKVDPSSEEIVKDLMKKYDDFRNRMDALAATSTVAGKDTNKDQKRDPHVVCVGDENKGCISPGNAGKAPYFPIEPQEPQETKGVLSGLGLLDPQLYKKSLKEAENKRKEISKASASCKEKLSLRACQSKKSTESEMKNPCKSTGSKCSDSSSSSKCGPETKSVKNFDSLTEPSSPFKCGSKTAEFKCGPEKLVSKNPSPEGFSECSSEPKQTCGSVSAETKGQSKVSSCGSDGTASKLSPVKNEPKDSCKIAQSAKKSEKQPTCGSEKPEQRDPCKVLPKITSKQNKGCKPKSQEGDTKSKCSSESKNTDSGSIKPSESNLEDPCKILPIAKTKSCGSSTAKEDPCKVPPIAFKKTPEKSDSVSKCSAPPKSKCEAKKEEKPPSSASMAEKSASASRCSSKPDDSKSSCNTPSETSASKCCSKCSSGKPCVKSQKEPSESDAEKACKRVAKQSCDSEPKNPCKSPCDSVTKPKAKCGRPPRRDTRPRCKKDSKCGSKKPSPCASKDKSEPKCGTEMKTPAEPSKCGSKTCAPSPKTSKTEIKPKSTCNFGHTKPAKAAPSSEPPKRKLHSLSRFSISNLIFSRNFSDDCPEKPKGGYKLKSEKSDEYRRETCENFSWKASKSRKNQTKKPKNCYPEETLEFCPDTACYKVYAETSGKADKKKGKKKPKGNNMNKNEALCTKRTITNSFDNQKRNNSTKARENEEALIQKPHSICTRKLTLPNISDNDALICIDSVALSDTDIYMFETGGRHTPTLTLGNEATGVVTEVGRSICNLKPGDHVVLESGIPCFKCDLCKMGRYNLCNNLSFRGFLKNQCIHPASFCHKICPPIPLEHAALIPQLALGCNACYQAVIKPNSNVAILGSCAKTVCAAICAISMGAKNVCVMCGMPETRILIEQFVTEKVNCFGSNTTEKGIVRNILASLGTFPDIVINCSASTKTMNAAIIALKPAGVCIVAGFLSECVSYNIMDAFMKEIQIIPSFRSKNMFPKAIHLLESGRAPLDCLIANCEICKWNELEGAFKLALSEGNNGPRKAIVKCQLND